MTDSGGTPSGPRPGTASNSPTPASRPTAPPSSPPPSGTKPPTFVSELRARQEVASRGLAIKPEIDEAVQEIERQRPGEPAKRDARKFLEEMVRRRYLTQTQAVRLLRELAQAAEAGAGKLDIPGYEILAPIGQGSMGMVYKARQTSVDRIVALKMIRESLASDENFVTRFVREAKNAARLAHNNIVNVYDAGVARGRHFFVMEYVEGSTVKDQLDQGKPYEPARALEIVIAVARALKHASEKGLIHRDIKPENIIITKDGVVKLADLGLARPVDDDSLKSAEAGLAIGTPYYISPEQVFGRTDIDVRADIYSLGATFYHMVTGKVPFEGDDPVEVMKKHISKTVDLVPPDQVNPKVPDGMAIVIETMMARDRAARYQKADDLLIDLECLQRGERPLIAEQRSDELSALAAAEAEADAADPDELTQRSYADDESAELIRLRSQLALRTTLLLVIGLLFLLSFLANIVILAR